MRKERALRIELGKLVRLRYLVYKNGDKNAMNYLDGARQALQWALSTKKCFGNIPVVPSPSCCDQQNGGFRNQYTWRAH